MIHFVSGISWTLYCLASNPDYQRRCREEVNKVMGDNNSLSWWELNESKIHTNLCWTHLDISNHRSLQNKISTGLITLLSQQPLVLNYINSWKSPMTEIHDKIHAQHQNHGRSCEKDQIRDTIMHLESTMRVMPTTLTIVVFPCILGASCHEEKKKKKTGISQSTFRCI